MSMPNETSVSDVFWAAAGSEPLPMAEPVAKSSCCGPKTEASESGAAVVNVAAAPKASSCCGAKSADEAVAAEAKPKSSCCG
jgi:hypothetical protein